MSLAALTGAAALCMLGAFDPALMRADATLGISGLTLGTAGVHLLDVDGDPVPEILVGQSSTWHLWQWDAPSSVYVQRHFRERPGKVLTDPLIVELAFADTDGDGRPEIVVLYQDGSLESFDASSGAWRGSQTASLASADQLAIADLDPAPGDEIVVYDGTTVAVFQFGVSTPLWSVSAAGGLDIAAGNVDSDAAVEIVVSNGPVIDASLRAIEWTFAGGFGYRLALGDVDGDGRDEILAAHGTAGARAVDGASRLQLWLAGTYKSSAILARDIDGDGRAEVLLSSSKPPAGVHIVNGLTGVDERYIDHGLPVAGFGVGDVDGDCDIEIVWASGVGTSSADNVVVVDARSGTEEWRSLPSEGPVSGLAVADLDRDARRELLWVSARSDGDRGPILHVEDLHHRRRLYTSQAGSAFGLDTMSGLAIAQLDTDGPLEYAMDVAEGSGSALVGAFDGRSHTLMWRTFAAPYESVTAVAAGDVDRDGKSEIVFGTAGSGPNALSRVRILRGLDGFVMWESAPQLPASGLIQEFRIVDIDADGGAEIVWVKQSDGIRVVDGVTRLEEWFQPLSAVRSLDVADVDGDGDLDLVVGDSGGQLLGFDGGTRAQLFAQAVGAWPIHAVRVADLDGDGIPQIVVAQGATASDSVLKVLRASDRSELWQSPLLAGTAGLASSLVVIDADDDGRTEVAVGTAYSVQVFEYGDAAPDVDAPVWPTTTGLVSAGGILSYDCCPAVQLAWEEANDGGSPPVEYNVYRGTVSGFTPSPGNRVVRTGLSGYRDPEVLPETDYFYIVRAVDRAGNEDTNTIERATTTIGSATPLTPTIESIVDRAACAADGLDIVFTYTGPTTGVRLDLQVDGLTRLSGVTSPVWFAPGDSLAHQYRIVANHIYCPRAAASAGVVATDEGAPPQAPQLVSVTDADGCVTGGVEVVFSHPGPPPGARFDLVVDGSVARTDVASPVPYAPADPLPRSYIVRLVDPGCSLAVDSGVVILGDSSGEPAAPTAVTVTDLDVCAISLARINFGHGGFPAAGHYELWRDGALFRQPIADNYTFPPGDLLTHRYAVRAVDDRCALGTLSGEVPFADGMCGAVGEPRVFLTRSGPDEVRAYWDAASGSVASYNLYSGTLDSLHLASRYDHEKVLAGASFPDSPTPSDGCDVASGSALTARVSGVPPGGFYFLLVAVNTVGQEGPYGKCWDGVRDIHDPSVDPRPASVFCP